ncbi:MAG: hypothetical protein FWD57_12200, partial [Polyangiaceae bacterium]|nr:hypothetical protein [Polyangiaceae bacterium]
EPNHPLVALSRIDPSALEYLSDIKWLRDGAAHYSRMIPSPDVALEARDRMYSLLRMLVGVSEAGVVAGNTVQSRGAELELRVRNQAEQLTELKYPGVADRPNLRTRLIDMHASAMVVSLVGGSSDGASVDALRGRIREAVVAATIAMEAVFSEVEVVAPIPARISDDMSADRERNASILVAAAVDVGFSLDKFGFLSQRLTHVSFDRLRRASKRYGQTLSSRVCGQVLAARGRSDHPMREIAKRVPSLLLDIGRIVESRGHGDECSVTVSGVAEIEAMVAKDVCAILEAIR